MLIRPDGIEIRLLNGEFVDVSSGDDIAAWVEVARDRQSLQDPRRKSNHWC